MQSTILLKTVFGSHLYGTSTPNSDKDYKQIHKCNVRDIILGKDLMNLVQNTNSSKGKNTKDDVDLDSKELRQFIKDCLQGQTYAFDVLFTPEKFYIEVSQTWNDLIKYRDKLVTRNLMPFLGYVSAQAFKYSRKGSTLKELEDVINKLKSVSSKLLIEDAITTDPKGESVKIINKFNPSVKKDENYLIVGSSSYPMRRQIADALPSLVQKWNEYGERAQNAKELNGVDLKAFYHAFRICWELEDILTQRKIEFPSHRVSFLREIRNGTYKKDYIENWLIDEIERVKLIDNNLPEPDYDFWNDWIVYEYLGC